VLWADLAGYVGWRLVLVFKLVALTMHYNGYMIVDYFVRVGGVDGLEDTYVILILRCGTHSSAVPSSPCYEGRSHSHGTKKTDYSCS